MEAEGGSWWGSCGLVLPESECELWKQ